jgi:hypothetical protein
MVPTFCCARTLRGWCSRAGGRALATGVSPYDFFVIVELLPLDVLDNSVDPVRTDASEVFVSWPTLGRRCDSSSCFN